MRAYFAFTKKELIENLRTYRVFILAIVFLLFGFMNPAFAKFMPDILKSAAPSGIKINIPPPTALDSWGQFFKNVGQMGFLVLVIVFCGIMANEFNRSTLINMLTKGLKRSTVIFSKFTVAVAIWTLSYLLCFIVTYFYTDYYWKMDGMHHVFLTFFSLWLFGILLIALLILGGVWFKNIYGSLLLTGGNVVTMMLLNINPKLHKYNPITLSSENMSLLNAQKEVSDFIPAIIICAIFIIALVASSVAIFNKKQV
ncbi:ABC transporter permease [Microbacteriaceae bacterium 4G12]